MNKGWGIDTGMDFGCVYWNAKLVGSGERNRAWGIKIGARDDMVWNQDDTVRNQDYTVWNRVIQYGTGVIDVEPG